MKKNTDSQKSPIAIIGLGNPGDEFQHSPHNAGFAVLDSVAKKLGLNAASVGRPSPTAGGLGTGKGPVLGAWEKEKDALVAQATIHGKKIILAKPQSFMNNSGAVVARLKKFYHLSADTLWIVHDDVDILLGDIKIVHNRSAAGHKGVESIIAALKTQNFTRFRVGIRSARTPKSRPKKLMVRIVTKPYTGENRKKFDDALKKCADAVSLALEKGIPQAMNETNR